MAAAPFPFAAEAAALASSVLWAGAGIVFRKMRGVVPPAALNFTKNGVATLCFAVVGLVLVGRPYPTHVPLAAQGWLVLSGLVGLAVCDTFLLRAMMEIGPRRATLLMLTAPVLVFGGALFPPFSQRAALTDPAVLVGAALALADVLRELALKAPPNVGDGLTAILDAARQGRRVAGLALATQRDMLDLFAKSARTFLDGWFESEAVKAAFGFDAVVGNYASPDTPGSAYVLLHHVFGEVNGNKGAWGHVLGGMGAITQAMAKVVQGMGVQISLEAPVAQVIVDAGRAVGVRLESGEEVVADIVIANVGPKLLYERMIAPSGLPADFLRRIRAFKVGSGTFRMNVALSRLPNFSCLPGEGEHLQSGIIIAPTLDYMDQAFLDARQCGMSRAPIVEMLIPSIVDDSLAPPGGHVASLFCQQFAPVLPGGRSWDVER